MSLDRQNDDDPPPLPRKWTCPNCRARADVYPDPNKKMGYGINCERCGADGDPHDKSLPIVSVRKVTKL